MNSSVLKSIMLLSIFGLSIQAEAISETSKSSELGAVKIIGSSEEELTQPSSAHFISKEKLELQQQSDVNRVLKQVPGVYVREEDGFGLRPNIGLRGTHPDRSKKIVILEDGILIGPAPYSAPAAYYTPFMSKIESLEVFKGVASVPFGPNSIGGAINYITRSIPRSNNNEIELGYGSFNTQKYRANFARVFESGGVMFEGTHMQNEGFKKLTSGADTGFSKNDFLLKGEYFLDEARKQSLHVKVGYATEVSNETYLGLTMEDFDNDPFRRYAASELDKMDWQHEQYQISYKNQLSDSWGVWTTLYHHKFHRDWRRFDGLTGATTPSVNDILLNDSGPNLQLRELLRGNTDSATENVDIIVLNNNRYYFSQGVQLGSFSVHPIGEWVHQLSAGLRFHEDQIKRAHLSNEYAMTAGHLVRTSKPTDELTHNRDNTKSVAVTLSDDMILDSVGNMKSLKITTSVRFENLTYLEEDLKTGSTKEGSENFIVPGVGVLQQIDDQWSIFVGVNRGYSIIGPGQNMSQKPEESINYELGTRYSNAEHEFFAEAIGFFNDYQNIKETCSFSSGCGSSTIDQGFDGGKAQIRGLEMRAQKGLQYQTIYFPVGLNVTYTKAEFKNSFTSNNEVWGKGAVHSGDPMPYVPELQYSLNIGAQYKKFVHETTLTWTGKMYNESVSTDRREIPSYGVVDMNFRYSYSDAGAVFARFDNVLDRNYVVSLKPYGARPGKPQSVLLGIKHHF